MTRIVNTAAEDVHRDWVLGGNPGAIEDQEKEGQRQLCDSMQIPVRGSDNPAFAEMGIEFGDVSPGDPLFREVTLPDGWEIKPTEHSMWSNLIDADGTVKAEIFYKAAFYDRGASLHTASR